MPAMLLLFGPSGHGFFLGKGLFDGGFPVPVDLQQVWLRVALGAFFLGMGYCAFIHETLSFRRLDCQHRALSIIQLTAVPYKVKLPEIAV
jgi:hypothetical protein